MAIWIDAEAFVEALNRSSVWGWSTEQDKTAHKWVLGEIEKFLNDNENQLVKCEDCKYWHNNTEFCDLWSIPNVAQHTYPNGYCFRAERREP